MSWFQVMEVRTGRVRPLGARGVPSGIRKFPVQGPVVARTCGLEGDEQGDQRNHGGRNKAVHAYVASHYAAWASELPDLSGQLEPGAFGENLVVQGVAEADICLGDRWQLGGALLEVSQSRQPCWRLNLRFGRPDMARRVQTSGRSGWYFRVVEPGDIAAGQMARLVGRPHPDWSLERVHHLLYLDCLNHNALKAFAALPELPEKWRALAERRLESGRTEDWANRIETPE